MREGHRQAQGLFLELGRRRGFSVRRQFTKLYPTDGVWLTRLQPDDEAEVPIAAIEVICSESPKTVLGYFHARDGLALDGDCAVARRRNLSADDPGRCVNSGCRGVRQPDRTAY
jgi:hypothetical protein